MPAITRQPWIPRLTFWIFALLLAGGLMAMVPLAFFMVCKPLAGLATGSAHVPSKSMQALAIGLWFCGGPLRAPSIFCGALALRPSLHIAPIPAITIATELPFGEP